MPATWITALMMAMLLAVLCLAGAGLSASRASRETRRSRKCLPTQSTWPAGQVVLIQQKEPGPNGTGVAMFSHFSRQ